MALLKAIEACNLNLDIEVYNIVINGMCKTGELEAGRDVFLNLPSKSLHPVTRTYNSMIQGLCKSGLLDEANKLFMEMEENDCSPDGCNYKTLSRGFSQ